MKAFFDDVAEKSVLYAFVMRQEMRSQIGKLIANDFYRLEHQKIFTAIQEMYIKHVDIDLGTVPSMMRELFGVEERGLTEKLVQICGNIAYADTWAIEKHIEIIKANALRRKMMEVLRGAQSELMDEENATDAVLDKVRQQLRDIVTTNHQWESIRDVFVKTYSEIEKRSAGEVSSIPSGIPALERITNGFHAGELTIIGARPAVGKSAFGAQIALAAARGGYRVGVCSREMTDIQYGTRIVANGTDIDNTKLRTGELEEKDWKKIAETMALYSKLNVSFVFTTRYVEDLRMEVQKKVDSGELDILIVDYVQLLQSRQKFEKDYLRIAYVSKMLKDMTVDFGISIIGLAQVGRAAENDMPTMAELRGSGDLEQDADNVIFLHRPTGIGDKYVRPEHKELYNALIDAGRQYIVLDVAKQRQGNIGTVSVIFEPNRMRFLEIQVEQNQPSQ